MENVTENSPKNAAANEHATRRGTHIVGALIIASLMAVALALAPRWGQDPKKAQLAEIQRLARVDLIFIAQAEHKFRQHFGTYTTDLNALGIAPKKVLFKFGFVKAAQGLPTLESAPFKHNPELKDLDALKAALPALNMELSPLTKLSEIDLSALEQLCADCTATQESFRAIAAANLDDDAELDVWTINEKGEVKHLANDLQVAPATTVQEN